MKEEFITYEQALALKELGFDKDCLGRWLAITEWEEPTGEIKLQLGVKVEDYDKNQCLAPLKQQAFRWFREKHRLDGKPEYFLNDWYCFIINDMKGTETSKRLFTEFPSYEEAEYACIDKLIEIIKNK